MTHHDFPLQLARTRRFSAGQPRSFRITEDGSTVLFLRSGAGDDPVNGLWCWDVASSSERLLVDPAQLVEGDDDLPPEERARRERAREIGGGIVRYATDRAARRAVFGLGGRAYDVAVPGGEATALPLPAGAYDVRPDPAGSARFAFVHEGGLHLADGAEVRALAVPDGDDVTWGLADFVAAEEMGRTSGYWWAPDGDRLVVARVDVGAVERWTIADPADPRARPSVVRYPAAGTANADVSLWLVDLDGTRHEVAWDRDRHPYLVDVVWEADAPLTVVVQSRDQRELDVRTVDAATGGTTSARTITDPGWVDIVGGVPRWDDGALVTVEVDHATDTYRICRDGEPVTPPGLQVRELLRIDDGVLWFTASSDPVDVGVHRVVPGEQPTRVTPGAGVHHAAVRGGTVVVISATVDAPTTATIAAGDGAAVAVRSHAEEPVVTPRPRFLDLGSATLRGALLLPTDDDGGPLPVVMSPYGGPHAQRVLRARAPFTTAQWLADQGFAVLVVDGRGTPGRGPAWDRAIHRDLAVTLDDQVVALREAAAIERRLDLGRVAIRGWSFGGYLAALAVLRRPDVFHAAVAGAPVADWALYDTHYTERYLGTPQDDPEAYRTSGLVDADGALVDAVEPPGEHPRMLIIHGLADDNVVAAHSLRLSHALLAAGRPHTFLPLTGVTHMTPQQIVTRRLLELELAFLRDALSRPGDVT